MSSIEELQKRVVEAESRFGLIDERRKKYSERLVGLIDAVESRLREQTAAVQSQAEELASQLEIGRHASEENQALRTMLHSLLRAIEAGSRDVLSDTMQAMDAKVSTLIAETETEIPFLSPPRQSSTPQPVPGPTAAAPPLDAAADPEIEAQDRDEPEPESEPAPEALEERAAALASPGDAVSDAAPADDPIDTLEDAPVDAPVDTPEDTPEDTLLAAGEASGDAPAASEPDLPESGGLSAAQVADLLGSAEDIAASEEVEDPGEFETFPVEDDDPALELAADQDLGGEGDMAPPVLDGEFDAEPESGDPFAVEDAPASDEPAAHAVAEADEISEPVAAFEEPAPEPTLEVPEADAAEPGPVQEDAADPAHAATGEAGEDRADAASLEDIMRRVSKLVEDEGALGPLGAGSVRIGAGADDDSAPEGDVDSDTPAAPKKAASF